MEPVPYSREILQDIKSKGWLVYVLMQLPGSYKLSDPFLMGRVPANLAEPPLNNLFTGMNYTLLPLTVEPRDLLKTLSVIPLVFKGTGWPYFRHHGKQYRFRMITYLDGSLVFSDHNGLSPITLPCEGLAKIIEQEFRPDLSKKKSVSNRMISIERFE